MDITHTRLSFAQAVRRAIRAGQLVSYERDQQMGRAATLATGETLTYDPRAVRDDAGRTVAPPQHEPAPRPDGPWTANATPRKPLVMVCAWCPDHVERTASARAHGFDVTHGMCSICAVTQWTEATDAYTARLRAERGL